MYSAIAANKRNTVFVMLLFIVLIAGLGALVGFLWGTGDGVWWITIGVFVGAIVYAVIQYFASSAEALAITGARQIQREDNPVLWNMVENLCIASGMPMPKVHVIHDPSPNAFATGRSPDKASIAVTTGLLEIMDGPELEGVLAHELGHVKNYDIRLNMIVFGLVVAIGMIADILLRMSFYAGRGRNNNNGNPIMLVIGLAAMIVAPLIAALVQAAVSRQREYLADASGAMMTRHPEALASALEKIEQAAIPMRRQNSSTAHLWFSNPLKGGMTRMFSTHPPTADRIKRLRAIGGGF